MINIKDISFNEMDNDELPLQFFFAYNSEDASKLVRELLPNINDNIEGVELCLSMYSYNDYKLEAVISFVGKDREWITIHEQMYDANEYIELIHSTDTEEAREAYAHYQYLKENEHDLD